MNLEAVMAATELFLTDQYQIKGERQNDSLEKLKAISGMLFRGCFHKAMSRPFTISDETHRVCHNCGATRRFDPHQWAMYGPYYFGDIKESVSH